MVEATISYLAAMPERPFFFRYDPPPGTPWRNTRGDRRPMSIRDARQLDPPPSLDREGFTLVRHVTAVEDLWDDRAVRSVYYRELETLVRDVTGAARAVAFDQDPGADGAAHFEPFAHLTATASIGERQARDRVGRLPCEPLRRKGRQVQPKRRRCA